MIDMTALVDLSDVIANVLILVYGLVVIPWLLIKRGKS